MSFDFAGGGNTVAIRALMKCESEYHGIVDASHGAFRSSSCACERFGDRNSCQTIWEPSRRVMKDFSECRFRDGDGKGVLPVLGR
jgi:hypothetical protein